MLRSCKKTALIGLVLVFALTAVAFPAQAASTGKIYHPEDYIDNVSVSGNKKMVTYTFDDATAITDIYWNDSLIGSKSGTFYNSFSTVNDFGEVLFSSYLLGVAGFSDTDAWSGVIDVSDIMPYADLKVTGAYQITISYNNTPPGDVVCQWRWGFLCYDADMHYVKTDYTPFTSTTLPGGAGAFGYVLDVTTSYTIPSNVAYIMPVVQSIWTVGDITYHKDVIDFYVHPYPFSMSCDIDMIYEQSNTMQAIEDKLDAIGDKIDGTNDKLDDTNDKLDDILKQPEQEKQEAGAAGDENVGALIDVIPNESQGFMNAVEGFASSMSYTGTSAVLSTPAVNFPQIGDLVPGFQIMPPMELDFEVYVEMMPESLLLLVRSLLTVALIVYCFKELYSTISYVLTLKGGGD